MTITLPTNPPQPPANIAPVSAAISGVITNTVNLSRPSVGTAQAIFTIPVLAATGVTNVVITFSPGPVYTLTNGFTIN